MDRKNQVQYGIIVPRDNNNALKANSSLLKSSTNWKAQQNPFIQQNVIKNTKSLPHKFLKKKFGKMREVKLKQSSKTKIYVATNTLPVCISK